MSFSSIAAIAFLVGAPMVQRLRGQPFSTFEFVLVACAFGGFFAATAFRDGLFQGVFS